MHLWKVLNVKPTDKGGRKRDSDMDVTCGVNGPNVVFLGEGYNWLVQ